MKALGTIGFVISVLVFLISMYLQFMVAPGIESLQAATDGMDFSDLSWAVYDAEREGMMNMGYVSLFGGGLSLILCAVGFMKTKSKIALVGMILALVSVFVGLLHATHMFS